MRKARMRSTVVVLALLAVYWIGAGSALATVPTLTHEWNFDADFNDSVGAKTADPLGTGTAVGTANGIVGGAAQFDGIDDLLYVAGMDAIPAGPFTISFWEYCQDSNNQGYFVSDAAVHPGYYDATWIDQWTNLMIRRRINYDISTGEPSIRGFAEIGPSTEETWNHPGYQPWLVDDGYWDPRWPWPEWPSYDYGDPRLNPELPTGEWVHHVITNYQSTTDNNGGRQVWYVNGQVALWGGPSPDPFPGLRPLDPEPITDPEDPFYFPNRREGFVIGNLIDNTNIAEFDAWYVNDARVGPPGNYHGKIDEFQIYNGTVTPDMVRYLREHPGANLTTYTGPAPPPWPGYGAHVFHWKFDGNLNEESGSGYNGTAIGNGVVGTTGGVTGGAVYFDGVNDAVRINKDVLPAGDLSVVFWAKEQFAVPADTSRALLADGADWTNFRITREFEYGPYYQPPRNTRVFEGDSSACWTLRFGQDGSSEMMSWSYDTWYQHAFVVSAEGDVRYYVNNVLMSETASFPFEGLLGDLFLGNDGTLNYDFRGYIDDLQIYDWDISTEGVAWLWTHPGETYPPPPPPPAWYDCNDDWFIGADDLDVVRAYWGQSVTGGKYEGDIDLDGSVGADDLDILRAHWGENIWPTSSALVPEPSTIVLLVIGALAVLAVRRAR